jgi:hypothetical protein
VPVGCPVKAPAAKLMPAGGAPAVIDHVYGVFPAAPTAVAL